MHHKTVRTKASVYFALGFTALWMICNAMFYMEFSATLWDNFDSEMKNKATLIAKQTILNPRLVPLPEDSENFLIIHTDFYETVDTLFVPPPDLFNRLSTERNVRIEEDTAYGTLTILYSTPADKVNESMRKITFLFFVSFLLALVLAVMLGFWLSGKLIRPINRIIKLADITDLHNNTQLLNESASEDELKCLFASFNRMLTRIKEQSDLQNTFFASASHELRTPLSVMQTRIQVLLSGEQLSDDTRQVFREQLTEVRRMIKIVNDFLLMSELQNGTMEAVKTECDIADLFAGHISRHKQKGIERGLSFKISFTPVNKTFTVSADEEMLSIIINNLIMNAWKYSQENQVIDILLEKTDTGLITVHVRNKIRKDITPDISAVKQSFYHAKPLHAEGSGLGLWIANRLSELNGFTLSVSMSDDVFDVSIHMNINEMI